MIATDVSKELRQLRIEAGYTQGELADWLMITPPTICKIEKGRIPDALTYLNWKHVCTHKPKRFTFEQGQDGSKMMQFV